MMPKSEYILDQATVDFIEAYGQLVGESGLPSSIGRVLGLLVITDASSLTAEAIGAILQLSVGSVSAAITFLTRFGYVKRTSSPGERRYYYEFDPRSWQKGIDMRLAQVREGIDLAERGLKIRNNDARLISMRSLYVQLYEAIGGVKVITPE